ncbi:hypothetical protein M407DRAFT_25285 [Tulasnella calospora MUT 4182]|uniref:Helicase ATP-binding domain-containing protein n=1 Tax=Tulasnella calospora MUT 4182 TaxID=1051891 RepID=A0A0C3Q774_9AGAM|nr:hypothetical protein M407DRAFT_25285 [Tulasnella calospora MUT 4182]
MLEGFSQWLKGTQPGGPKSPERRSAQRQLYPTLPEPSPTVSAKKLTSTPTSSAGTSRLPDVETLLPELSKLSISPPSQTKKAPAIPTHSTVPGTSPLRLPTLAIELPPSPFSNIKGGNPNANSPAANTKSPSNSLNPTTNRTPPKRTTPRLSKTPVKMKPNPPGPSGLPSSTPPLSPSLSALLKEEFKPPLRLDEILSKLNSERVDGLPDKEQLLKHQLEEQLFLAKSEHSRFRGGQLYDMGLGKTIQMIARILDSRPLQKEVGPTLIVVPNCLMNQWKEELGRFAPNLLVLVHHGPDRASNPLSFRKYDVIITTYDIVMNEYKNNTKQ